MKVIDPNKRKELAFYDWHRHPFAVPVITFLVLFFISCIAFVVLNGQTIGASDAKVVHLFVDGEKRVIPTRAQTVEDALNKAGVELQQDDVVEPTKDTPILDQDFNVNIYRARPVTIVDENKKAFTTKVSEAKPEEMAKEAGVNLYPEDKVDIGAPDEALKDGVIGARIVIDRATLTNINLYGTNLPTRTHSKTVGELIKEKNIKTIAGDTIQPSPETPIAENTQVFITRNGKQIVSIEQPIEAPVEKVSDPNAPSGSSTVKQAGAPGKKVTTFELDVQNGREVSRRPIQEVVAVQPVKKVVAEGTKISISNPSANVQIGQRLAAERGWTGSEFQCLYQLWQKESKWNHLAGNVSSGAYGIPQALPGSKMAANGPDWRTNPETQIKWGLGYIAKGYKTPCGAWAKSRASGWY